MNKQVAVLLGVVALTAACKPQPELSPEQATLTALGQPAPTFVVTTTTGKRFDLAEQKGKIVLLSFFATWCPPCREELPHLEHEVWARFKDQPFTMLCLGREHTAKEIAAFGTEQGLTFPIAADPKRAVYSLYASQYIPRTIVIGLDGTIVYQSNGFSEDEFAAMIAVIEQNLASIEAPQA